MTNDLGLQASSDIDRQALIDQLGFAEDQLVRLRVLIANTADATPVKDIRADLYEIFNSESDPPPSYYTVNKAWMKRLQKLMMRVQGVLQETSYLGITVTKRTPKRKIPRLLRTAGDIACELAFTAHLLGHGFLDDAESSLRNAEK